MKTSEIPAIAGVVHEPDGPPMGAVALTHGAGGSRELPMLTAVCDEWARRGWLAVWKSGASGTGSVGCET